MRIMRLVTTLFLCIMAAGQAFASDSDFPEPTSAEKLMQVAHSSYLQGQFTQAIQYWTEASRRYDAQKKEL